MTDQCFGKEINGSPSGKNMEIILDRNKLSEDLAFVSATMVEEQRLYNEEIELAKRKIELRDAQEKLKSFRKKKLI